MQPGAFVSGLPLPGPSAQSKHKSGLTPSARFGVIEEDIQLEKNLEFSLAVAWPKGSFRGLIQLRSMIA